MLTNPVGLIVRGSQVFSTLFAARLASKSSFYCMTKQLAEWVCSVPSVCAICSIRHTWWHLVADLIVDPEFIEWASLVHSCAVSVSSWQKRCSCSKCSDNFKGSKGHSWPLAFVVMLQVHAKEVLVIDLAGVWSNEAKAGSLNTACSF